MDIVDRAYTRLARRATRLKGLEVVRPQQELFGHRSWLLPTRAGETTNEMDNAIGSGTRELRNRVSIPLALACRIGSKPSTVSWQRRTAIDARQVAIDGRDQTLSRSSPAL